MAAHHARVRGRVFREPLAATALAAGTLFVGLAVLVQLRVLRGIDLWILERMRDISSYPLDVVSQVFSYFGSPPWGLLVALVLVAAWRDDERYRWVPLLVFVITMMEWGLKVGIDDPVPPVELHRHVQPAIPWLPRMPTLPFGHFHEFPSGHTARTAFLAVVAGWRYPSARVALAIVLAGMVLTRIYVGNRFASASLGGALLGIAMGSFGLWIANRMRVS